MDEEWADPATPKIKLSIEEFISSKLVLALCDVCMGRFSSFTWPSTLIEVVRVGTFSLFDDDKLKLSMLRTGRTFTRPFGVTHFSGYLRTKRSMSVFAAKNKRRYQLVRVLNIPSIATLPRFSCNRRRIFSSFGWCEKSRNCWAAILAR